MGWCKRRKIDPFRPDIAVVCNFLSDKFDKGLKYNTIAGYRSALSSYLGCIEGFKVGQHPEVIKLLKGVFNVRPPTRHLTPLWDLKRVLNKLKGPPFEPLDQVSLKWRTRKTALLVALATAARSSDIAKLGYTDPHLRYERNPTGIRLIPRNLRKQDRQSHCFKDLFIAAFTEDRKLDPVRAVQVYLKSVRARRGNLKSLFVTFGAGQVTSPTSQTIAHWVVDAIEEGLGPSGINAHTTRSISTTVALLKGVGLENILKAADWSGSSTFANHYLKEYRERESLFGRAVLSGSGPAQQ